MSSMRRPVLSVRTQTRPSNFVSLMSEVLRGREPTGDAGGRDHGRAGQIGRALALLAGEVPVAGADLDLAFTGQAGVALGAAAAARVEDDRPGVEELADDARMEEVVIDPPGGRHDLEHDPLLDLAPLQDAGRGLDVLDPAVGARADEPGIDPDV